MKLSSVAKTVVEIFLGVAAVIAFGAAMFGLGKAKASNEAVWDALFSTPAAPALEITDEFILDFVEGKIDIEMIEAHGVGIDYDTEEVSQ